MKNLLRPFSILVLTIQKRVNFENNHPEMTGQIDKVAKTLSQPEIVVRSKTDSEAELFYRHYLMTPIGEKYICVVVKVKVDELVKSRNFDGKVKSSLCKAHES